MSNETASDKKPAATALTRIPVRHLFFADNTDLPGGTAQVSNVKCYADPAGATRYFTCEFIPAWQMFEITFVPGGASENVVRLMPACHVRTWQKG